AYLLPLHSFPTRRSSDLSSSVRATTLYQPLSNRYTCDPCSPSRSRRSPFSKVSRRPRPVISSRISRGRPPRRLVAGHGLVSVSGRRTGLLRESGGAIRSPRIAVRFVRDAPLGSQWELWSSRLNCRTFSPICRLPRETLPVIQGVRTMARPVAAEPYCARLSGGGGWRQGDACPPCCAEPATTAWSWAPPDSPCCSPRPSSPRPPRSPSTPWR